MKEILKIIPILLYTIVGIISMIMAVKNLSSNKFLPFHEKVAKKPWDEIDNPIKLVILTFMRLTVIGNCKCTKSVNKNVSKFSKINFRFSEQI